ncbi:hypothetical protein ACJX0J_015982, partial [Zea mays]
IEPNRFHIYLLLLLYYLFFYMKTKLNALSTFGAHQMLLDKKSFIKALTIYDYSLLGNMVANANMTSIAASIWLRKIVDGDETPAALEIMTKESTWAHMEVKHFQEA